MFVLKRRHGKRRRNPAADSRRGAGAVQPDRWNDFEVAAIAPRLTPPMTGKSVAAARRCQEPGRQRQVESEKAPFPDYRKAKAYRSEEGDCR